MAFRLTYTTGIPTDGADADLYADRSVDALTGPVTRAARWVLAARAEARRRGHPTARIHRSPERWPSGATWLLTEPFDPVLDPPVVDDDGVRNEEDTDGTGERTLLRFRVPFVQGQWWRPFFELDVSFCFNTFGSGDPDPATLTDAELVEADDLARQILAEVLGHIVAQGPAEIRRFANSRVPRDDIKDWSEALHARFAEHLDRLSA